MSDFLKYREMEKEKEEEEVEKEEVEEEKNTQKKRKKIEAKISEIGAKSFFEMVRNFSLLWTILFLLLIDL